MEIQYQILFSWVIWWGITIIWCILREYDEKECLHNFIFTGIIQIAWCFCLIYWWRGYL
jgi:hypothetical protein